MATSSLPETSTAFPDALCGRVREHLEEILRGAAFSGSRRSQEFLRYVVEETLAGRGAGIKERNIAVDVFARGAAFDSQNESIVRVKAAEVRKRLTHAYEAMPDGSPRIELPVGTYQPAFHFGEASPIPETPEAPARGFSGLRRATRINAGNRAWRKRVWESLSVPGAVRLSLLAAMTALACAAVGLAIYSSPKPPSGLDSLWQPYIDKSVPVLISLPAPTVFEIRNPKKWLPLREGELVPAAELNPMETYFVGVGAALGAARFSEQLAQRNQPFFIKFGKDVTFSDLNHSPAILLGAFSSVLSMEMTQRLRFRLESDDRWNSIIDTAGDGRFWRVHPFQSDDERTEGYALVTRLLNSESGHTVLIAAGIGARDTQAAVEFLTNPRYFDLFAKSAGADWPKKNFQVVLHNYIHVHSPGAPSVVALHVW